MHSDIIPLIDIAQITIIFSIVTVWLVTASSLKSPWIPSSNFSRLAIVALVFVYAWNRFVEETILMGEPIYVWFGLVLILGIIAHWAKISHKEPAKRAKPF
ncbi:MAG: hypothetical protein JXM70_27305 [Pirellulales bacterium]|nr:hypothetical protein [Pirellulales bacterium]